MGSAPLLDSVLIPQRHRDCTDSQHPNVGSGYPHYYRLWIHLRQSKDPDPPFPHHSRGRDHRLLLRAGSVPERHWRLRSYDDW